jgi:ribonuclease HI
MKECFIYIESSLKWPKHGDGIVGLIFTDAEDEFSKTLFGKVQNATEYQSILIGIKTALSYVGSFELVHLHISCSSVANNFRNLPSWEANGFKNSKGESIKYTEEWQAIASEMKNKKIEVHLNEFNGYRRWLKCECDNRGRKHGFIL